MELFRREVGNDKPVAAVIYTHTHFDHYGGVKGVVDEADVASGKVPIVAPGTIASFDKFAIGENVITGNAMSRRMGYTFGLMLPHCDCGLVTVGLGAARRRHAHQPQLHLADRPDHRTGETRTLGGWDFEFLYAPDTEAPEEMHIWIPAIKALTCAENANHSMHNIQTIRGARTRDARNFARYLDETLVRWGDEVEVHYGPHTWPVWGNENVVTFLEYQRDMYKFMHDQALRLANQGLTPLEAAEVVDLPEAIGRKWYNRYYHGGLHHNVRAVFHKELGFWDGDPATILPLLPDDNAKRHVALIGRDKILAEGRTAIDAGDYRWAVQVLHHLVFADPDGHRGQEPAGRRLRAAGLSGRRCRSTARSSCPRRRNSGRGCNPRVRSTPTTWTPSWPCRSTCCSTSSACTSTATGRRHRPADQRHLHRHRRATGRCGSATAS